MKKQLVFLPTSLCAADTTESESDLKELFQTCELLLTVRSKPMQLPTLLRKWKRDNWMRVLCSRISRHFRIENYATELPFLVQDSLANHLAVQESDKQQKTQDTCTRGSQMELQLCDHDMSCSKTLKESSQPKQETENRYLNMSSETWKEEVTRVRGEYSVRLKSVHHTKENECSSWLSPQARDWKGPQGRAYKGEAKDLPAQTERNWATPQASDHVEGARTRTDSNQKCLGRDLGRLNTPPAPEKSSTSGKNKERLNPAWVCQLMGLPSGWTNLGSWVTE